MYALARGIVRHKVGTVAVIAIAIAFFSADKREDAERANNPWAAQAVAARSAPAEEPGLVDSAVDAGMAYLDEAGINPVTQIEENGERLDNTAGAVAAANDQN
jgi:hypothetical protein